MSSAKQEISQPFKETEGSLPHSPVSATYPCPEPDQSNQYLTALNGIPKKV